jgi:hypothetical protein
LAISCYSRKTEVHKSFNRPFAALLLSSKINTQITKKNAPCDKSANPAAISAVGGFLLTCDESAKI